MKDTLLFCGTGAADYVTPVPGQEFRKYTHSLLNDSILLDIGSMTYKFEPDEVLTARFSRVRHVLITHTHSDHFSREALLRLAQDNGSITVYLDASCTDMAPEHPAITVYPVSNGETLSFDGYTVHVFSSNHLTERANEQTHHYVIDVPSGKSIFYGLDGAWLRTDEAKYLMQHPVDLMILDATSAVSNDFRTFEHNTLDMLKLMIPVLHANGMLKPEGKIYADHLAKTLHPAHNAAAIALSEIGMQTAYDGLCIEF